MVDPHFLLNTPTRKQWESIGVRHHHGINVPLFSIRSKHSYGIGEFTDLLPLISWCREIGMDVIQTLPLNDNGQNTSPYNALSAFALNPLHLGLSYLPGIDQLPVKSTLLAQARALNDTQRIDYPRVHAVRDAFLREYYNAMGPTILASKEYTQFVDRNPWLEGYALFKALKIYGQWQNWEMWSDATQTPTEETFQELLEEFRQDVTYHSFIQYLCFQQFEEVKKEAEQQGVFLKGDIPILINRESADVWQHRSLFNMDYSAGAPPDMYTPHGQNWGFPTYEWEEIDRQGYHWWKYRLEVTSRLYHIYRLDHVVGFFRIWVIPPNLTGREGWFIPEDTSLWITQGEKILRTMIESCSMLPIGEDLGIVPAEVHQCLRDLGICGTKVPRWERNWDEDGSFIDPSTFPPASMTTVSTHDSETLQLWWQNNSEEAQVFSKQKGWPFTNVLTPDHRYELLRESHQSGSLFHINLLQEYLALIPGMTWSNPEDERINVPGTISNRNWSYRFLPSIEEITESQPLKTAMKDLIR